MSHQYQSYPPDIKIAIKAKDTNLNYNLVKWVMGNNT